MTTIQQQLDLIATCSQDKIGVTRYSFTREHKQAVKIIKSWMLAAGLTVSIDVTQVIKFLLFCFVILIHLLMYPHHQ